MCPVMSAAMPAILTRLDIADAQREDVAPAAKIRTQAPRELDDARFAHGPQGNVHELSRRRPQNDVVRALDLDPEARRCVRQIEPHVELDDHRFAGPKGGFANARSVGRCNPDELRSRVAVSKNVQLGLNPREVRDRGCAANRDAAFLRDDVVGVLLDDLAAATRRDQSSAVEVNGTAAELDDRIR